MQKEILKQENLMACMGKIRKQEWRKCKVDPSHMISIQVSYGNARTNGVIWKGLGGYFMSKKNSKH